MLRITGKKLCSYGLIFLYQAKALQLHISLPEGDSCVNTIRGVSFAMTPAGLVLSVSLARKKRLFVLVLTL